MESGLEDRNNCDDDASTSGELCRLNGVRPRRPEQADVEAQTGAPQPVSMESGLEDRNNTSTHICGTADAVPSQWSPA